MPAWGVRTALTALITFMSTPGEGSVGAIEWSDEQRKLGAKRSVMYVCNVCGSKNLDALPSEEEVPSVEVKSELMLNPTESKGSEEGQDVEMEKAIKESVELKCQEDKQCIATASTGTGLESTPVTLKIPTKVSQQTPTRVGATNIQTPSQPSPSNQHPWLWSIDVLIIVIVGILVALLVQSSRR